VHGGGTSSEILIRAATSPAPPLASLRPDIDPRVAALVDRALAFDKSGRWATAAAMRDAIREVEAQGSAGRQALADLVDEIGVTSTRPVSPHADTAAIPSSAAAFAAPDAQPSARAVVAAPEPDPTRASPLLQTGATAAPITRNAAPAPTPRPTAPVVRSALFGISMAFGLAALVLVPLIATGRYQLRAPARPVASETVFTAPTAPTPPSAPTSAPEPPSPASPAPAALPPTAASASADEERPQTPTPPASATPSTPQPPKPKAVAPLPGDTPRPAPPKHGTKPNDDDLFHP
jgi:serine/threonine-protein kinase